MLLLANTIEVHNHWCSHTKAQSAHFLKHGFLSFVFPPQYFLLCITMCVACGAAVWWSIENGETVKERIQRDLSKVMKEKYSRGATGATDLIIDTIQKDFQCCGVKGPSDWANSVYNTPPNNTKPYVDYGIINNNRLSTPSGVYKVPASCCQKASYLQCDSTRQNIVVGASSEQARLQGINSDGCLEKVNIYMEEQWKWLIIVAGVLIGVQFFALLFACCLCCAISREDDK